MKYLFAGLVAGALAGILFFQGRPASEIYPEFYSSISSLDLNITNDDRSISGVYVVPSGNRIYLVNRNGRAVKRVESGDLITEMSGDGRFYIQYSRTGTKIDFFGINGQRYWQRDSREKPLITSGGKIVLLLNGDHSGIRILDSNGNPAGAVKITGRLCTSIEFSAKNDFSACGFIDGSYYFIGPDGSVLNSGMVPAGKSVKGIRVSESGKFGLVHFGDTSGDGVRVVNIAENKSEDAHIDNVHYYKTAMCITDNGDAAIFDNDRVIIFDDDSDIRLKLSLPEKRPGYASLSSWSGIYTLGYTKKGGESQLVVFRESGEIFYTREFAGEAFLDARISDGFIFARGSDNLFAYSIRLQEN